MKKHSLPALPYAFSALEPHIDAQTLELHYSKHHQAYVDGLNAAEEKLDAARKSGDFSAVKHLKREIAFHGSGHILHSLYWASMAPGGAPLPEGAFSDAVDVTFGDFATFEKEFKAAATVVEASGWAILGYEGGRLEVYTSEKHQNLTQWGAVPLLACDVWEHAYYLRYQNRRAEYIENFWKLVDWESVAKRYDAAVRA